MHGCRGLTRNVLSQPAVTSRLTSAGAVLEDTRAPGACAGAHDTAVQPTACPPDSCTTGNKSYRQPRLQARRMLHLASPRKKVSVLTYDHHTWQTSLLTLVVSQMPSLLYSMTDTVPSLDALARIRPSSCGAQHMLFTDALCKLGAVMCTWREQHGRQMQVANHIRRVHQLGALHTCLLHGCRQRTGWQVATSMLLTWLHWPSCPSFHTMTRWSNEHDARTDPNFGCAQQTCHTGPSCPRRSARCVCVSPTMSKTLTERSEEHVANLRP